MRRLLPLALSAVLAATLLAACGGDDDDSARAGTCLERLRTATALSLSNDALAGVVVDLYLGAITSKGLNRRQPAEEDMLAVLRRLIPDARL